MAILLYHTFSFFFLFSYSLYHLISSSRLLLKPHPSAYSALPYHPLPLHSPLRHLPLYILLLSLLLSIIHQSLTATLPSFHTAISLFLLSVLHLSLLLPHPLPATLFFLFTSIAFSLLSTSHSPSPLSDLQSTSSSISSLISFSTAIATLILSFYPKLFIAEFMLSTTIGLQGLWSLQTGLMLYVDGFIPEGCHRLIDEEGVTRCDLEDAMVRGTALMELAFVGDLVFAAVVAVGVFMVVARGGGGGRSGGGGAYEVLASSRSSGALAEMDVQEKKNSPQA